MSTIISAQRGCSPVRGFIPEPWSVKHAVVTTLATIIALMGFGIASSSLYSDCAVRPNYQGFALGFNAGLPIDNIERFGAQVRATLTDEGWLETPKATRSSRLANTLRKLEAKGISVFLLRDKSGDIRAYAQLSADNQGLRVVLQ